MEVPPYQLQSLVSSVSSTDSVRIRCAQALGSEIYVGCSNGELLRYAIQAGGSSSSESYTLLSRQSVPNDRPIDEIILVPSISRAFVLSDRQVHFYTLPALDPLSAQTKPIRHTEALAVDEQQLRKFATSGPPARGLEPVDFCVIKRSSIALYVFKDKLTYRTEMPFPGGLVAKRSGHLLCIANKEMYNIVDLNAASSFPILPISQAEDGKIVKPSITVISENEFLLLSWTGSATMGVFVTGDGDPVRGTLEWVAYPESITLDYPFITAVLPSGDIEIHSIETQALVQSIPVPPASPTAASATLDRKFLAASASGFMVPAGQKSDKLNLTPVPLVRKRKPQASPGADDADGGLVTADSHLDDEDDEQENEGERDATEAETLATS